MKKQNVTLAVLLTLQIVFYGAAFAQSGSRQAPPSQPQQAPRFAPQQFQQPPASAAPRQSFVPRQTSPPRQQLARPRIDNANSGRLGIGQVDHRLWDDLLGRYVTNTGDVDYASWQASAADREQIRTYLRQLTSVDPSIQSSRLDQLAYWINTYNALTIEGILQVYPTKSIKDHAPDQTGFNIWDDFKLTIGGQQYSLNDIEHKVLRPMGDPRIHFAINCASKGCPQLANRAYFSQSVNRQMDDNARGFFADPEKFQYDLQRGELRVSPIIEWFADDFGRTDAERMQTLAPFMPDANSARLAASGQARVSYLDYDWSLNVATRTTPVRTQVTDTFRQSFVQPLDQQHAGSDCHARCAASGQR